jgi:hypothetical protein
MDQDAESPVNVLYRLSEQFENANDLSRSIFCMQAICTYSLPPLQETQAKMRLGDLLLKCDKVETALGCFEQAVRVKSRFGI